MPTRLSANDFNNSSEYREYEQAYNFFAETYRDVIIYYKEHGEGPEINVILQECRKLAANRKWTELTVGYARHLSKATLDGLRGSVVRLATKIRTLRYEASKKSRNPITVRQGGQSAKKSKDSPLEPGFSYHYVMQMESREWENARGVKITGQWWHVSEDGMTIWLYDTKKDLYFKMQVNKLSVKDRKYINDTIAECKSATKKWHRGIYAAEDLRRDMAYRDKALEKLREKSISGTKDIEVVQVLGMCALCNYGRYDGRLYAEGNNLICWQLSENGALANGDVLRDKRMFWAGTVTYTTVRNCDNTVSCFTDDFNRAIYLIRLRLGYYDKGDERFENNTPSLPEQPNRPSEKHDMPQAFGSGFFVTKNGYLVTNYHVIKGGDRFEAVTERGRMALKVIGKDETTDLAILKAEGDFVPVEFSRSAVLKLGSEIFTSGFPMPVTQGFSPKVTKGIISGENGMHDNPIHYQIDASIQPGNSGGPVCNESGEVVAVVVSTLSGKYFLNNQGTIPQNVNYAIKKGYVEAFLCNYPECHKDIIYGDMRKIEFSNAVEKVRRSIVLIEVY